MVCYCVHSCPGFNGRVVSRLGKFGRVQSDFHFFGAINAGREGLQLWQGLSEYGLLVVFHALPRHVAVFNHTKPGINFKSIVQWYSLSSDNSYHYHVYSVLLLIYCVFADVDIITLVINA